MPLYAVHRAQDSGPEKVEPATLVIGDPIPDVSRSPNWMVESRDRFRHDAEEIYRVLKHLPGGTVDALLVLMLDEKRSHFVVNYGPRSPVVDDPYRDDASDAGEKSP